MPAKSKAQQKLMGIVHAIQTGQMKSSDASPEARKMAATMKKKDAKDYASTKHKGLPDNVKQEAKAVSQAQRKYMGIVHAYKKGELKDKDLQGDKVQKTSKTIKDKDAKKFADTKQKGLPKRATKESVMNEAKDKTPRIKPNTVVKVIKKPKFARQFIWGRFDIDKALNVGDTFQIIGYEGDTYICKALKMKKKKISDAHPYFAFYIPYFHAYADKGAFDYVKGGLGSGLKKMPDSWTAIDAVKDEGISVIKEGSDWDYEFNGEKVEKILKYKGYKIKLAYVLSRLGKMYYATSDSGEPYTDQPPLHRDKNKALKQIKQYIDSMSEGVDGMKETKEDRVPKLKQGTVVKVVKKPKITFVRFTEIYKFISVGDVFKILGWWGVSQPGYVCEALKMKNQSDTEDGQFMFNVELFNSLLDKGAFQFVKGGVGTGLKKHKFAHLGENTLTDLPNDSEYGYTEDGVVKCIASKNTCQTRMRQDALRNPGRKYQLIYKGGLDLQEGDSLIEKLGEEKYGRFQEACNKKMRQENVNAVKNIIREISRDTISKKYRKLYGQLQLEWKWSDPEFKDAREVYHGPVFSGNSGKNDKFFTVKDKRLWSFVHGVNDTKHPPYVKPLKKVNIKFPSGDNDVEYEGDVYGPIGNVTLYKLKDGKFLWEY